MCEFYLDAIFKKVVFGALVKKKKQEKKNHLSNVIADRCHVGWHCHIKMNVGK